MAFQPANPYRRLPGTGYRRIVPSWVIILLFFVIGIFALLLQGRRVQLWLGDEHLLLVEWDGAREYYKRFRFQDIQALIVIQTSEGRILNWVLGVIIFAFSALALAVNDSVGSSVLLVLAGIFALILMVNVAYGPTCKCHLRTAVQTDELPSLNRLRRAREALNRLRPLIAAAQGELSPEEIPARMQELATRQSAEYIVDDPNAPPRMIS